MTKHSYHTIEKKRNALYTTKKVVDQLIIIKKIEMFLKHDYKIVLTIVFNVLLINQMKIESNMYLNT